MKFRHWFKRVILSFRNINPLRIFKGIKNLFSPRSILYYKRKRICDNCELLDIVPLVGEVCGHCNCILNIKLSIPKEKCPIGKWEADEEFL